MEKARMLGMEQAVVGGTEGGRSPTGAPAAGDGRPMPNPAAYDGSPIDACVVNTRGRLTEARFFRPPVGRP